MELQGGFQELKAKLEHIIKDVNAFDRVCQKAAAED